MKPIPASIRLARRRIVQILSAWFYAYGVHFAHVNYLNPEHEAYGFTYRTPGLIEVTLMAFLVTLGAAVLPTRVVRASSIVTLLLFLIAYVPTVVITLSLDADRIEHYSVSLLALGFAFAVSCFGARQGTAVAPQPARVPDAVFCRVIFACWIVCCVLLVYTYHSIMAIADLDEIYKQRAAAAASTSIMMGYVQTYFSNVLSPALIAIGLVRSRIGFIIAGSIGCLIMYSITAQRTVFLLPIAIIGLHFLLRSNIPLFRTSAFAVLGLAVATVASVASYANNLVASFFSTYLVFRTIGLPGVTYSLYHEVFGANNLTWWSHTKGFRFLVPVPAAFAEDPAWPALGYIIGDWFYDNADVNVNAHLFSSDGMAAAGSFGVIVIGVVLAGWLMVLDRVTRGWDRNFVILVSLPLGLSLTNSPFFTMMLSFGGLFWLLTFYLYKPRADTASPLRIAANTTKAQQQT